MEANNTIIPLSQAVETIKTAILQGQHEALKGTNRVQLAVYYGIGKYLSKNTRRFTYGTGALKAISEQLRKEMPGLRGFATTQLYEMRKFYEAWLVLDSNITVTTVKSESIAINESFEEVPVTTVKLQQSDNQIDSSLYRHLCFGHKWRFSFL